MNPYHKQLSHETFQQFVSRINCGATIMEMPVQAKTPKHKKAKKAKKSRLHAAMAQLTDEERQTLLEAFS